MVENAGKRRYVRSLKQADEKLERDRFIQHLVELGDTAVARKYHQPGWRWSTDMRPVVGGEYCQVRHVGVVLQGRLGVELDDGTTFVCETDDFFDIPPNHDGWVIGDEELILLEWSSSVRTWARPAGGGQRGVLVTLLFTDLVDSTATANSLGDAAWHSLLADHFDGARWALERLHGREVKTTGDGMLATFEGTADALECAAAIRDIAIKSDLHIRAGVHVGEVHMVGSDVRGTAVHLASRIMSKAGADEILTSETTRVLASISESHFEERGQYELKGFDGKYRLFAYTGGQTAVAGE